MSRGVRFRFFHRVSDLVPAADGGSIASILLRRQVDLAVSEYDPLVRPGNLPSWPSAPLYGQIDPAQAKALQDRGRTSRTPGRTGTTSRRSS